MTGGGIDGNSDFIEAQRAALSDLLSQIDPGALSRHELMLMTDVLGKALASFGDPPSNLGDQLIV